MSLVSTGKKTLFAVVIAAWPFAQVIAAQASLSLEERVQERAQRLAEQQQPRTAAPFDPGQFDKYAGVYQLERYQFMALTRDGEHFFAAPVGQENQKLELHPESPTKFFFSKTQSLQISFPPGAQGKAAEFIFHTKGFEIPCPKVDEATAKTAMAELAARVKNQAPSPGTEKALRGYIAAFQLGRPNYDEMTPIEQLQTYERAPAYTAYFQRWGALTSLTFAGVLPNGFDKYVAVYEHARAEMTVDPLSPDGKTSAIRIGKVENQ